MDNHSVRRIKKLKNLNNALKYLEIGVGTGKTFLELDFEFKDGVDPHFRFDTKLYKNDKHRFFEINSDKFWLSNNPQIYDIIFLDGLHTFEQTFRDLICSLKYCHNNSIWLLDDTVPSDIFSAIKNQKQSYDIRSRHNFPGKQWHGDIFKIIPAIREYFPIFNFLTIIDKGNPQTIAWLPSEKKFKPMNYNLEVISRFDYLDIEKNRSLFNLKKEDDAFNYLNDYFKN